MKKTIEKPFTLFLANEEEGKEIVNCVLHWYEIHTTNVEEFGESVGTACITIEGAGDNEEYAIWAGDKDTEHYLCLPTFLPTFFDADADIDDIDDYEEEEEEEEDELQIIYLDEFLQGLDDSYESHIKEGA